MGVSKPGDKNLRRLPVECAGGYMQRLLHQSGRLAEWVQGQADATSLKYGSLRISEQTGTNSLGGNNTTNRFELIKEPTVNPLLAQ